MTAGCSPELLTALVDGALSHDERDRVHAHLAGCDSCRTEVDALRRLKTRLSGLAAATPPPPDGLVESLRALAVPAGPGPARRGPTAPPLRSDAAPVAVRRPPRRRRHRLRAGRLAVGSFAVGGVVVAGLGAALLLGGSGAAAPATTPVDPGSDAFVVDFASTTGAVPFSEPAGAALSLTSTGR